jgi:hypothetical protein
LKGSMSKGKKKIQIVTAGQISDGELQQMVLHWDAEKRREVAQKMKRWGEELARSANEMDRYQPHADAALSDYRGGFQWEN